MSVCFYLKCKLAILRFVSERTRYHFDQTPEEYLFGFDRYGPGFDL